MMFNTICQETTSTTTTMATTTPVPETETSTTVPTTTKFLWPWERTEKSTRVSSTTEVTTTTTATTAAATTTRGTTEEECTGVLCPAADTTTATESTTEKPTSPAETTTKRFLLPSPTIDLETTSPVTKKVVSTTTMSTSMATDVGSGDVGTTTECTGFWCWGRRRRSADQPVEQRLDAVSYEDDELPGLNRFNKRWKRSLIPSCVGLPSPHESSWFIIF